MKENFSEKFEIFKLKFFIKLPFILILIIIACLYTNYMTMHIIPNYLSKDESPIFFLINNDNKTSIILFHILLLLVLLTMFRTIFTNPGTIPEDWNHQLFETIYNEFIKYKTFSNDISQSGGNFYNLFTLEILKEVNINNKDFKDFLRRNKIRFCKYCEKFKPNRAHHCRQCSKCVLKMDHHCNWILNCVGFRNYKFFLQFIFYTNILLIFYTVNFTESILWNDLMENPAKGFSFFIKSFNWLFALSFSFLLSLLNFLHLGILVKKNRSTIEFCENKNDNTKYDKGFFKNWLEIMGYNPIGWFLPISAPDRYKGLKFEIKFKKEVDSNNEENDKLIF